MLRTLRKLFEPETAPPRTGAGKLTLRDVLLRGWDELWYQPKIELRTKRLVGAEGLLRARRPTRLWTVCCSRVPIRPSATSWSVGDGSSKTAGTAQTINCGKAFLA